MRRSIIIRIAPVALLFCTAGAQAAVTLSSGAAALSTNVSAAGIVKASASVAAVSGTAGAAYDVKGGVASVNQTFTLVSNPLLSAYESLTSGIVTTEAFSSLPNSATGTTTLAGAGLSLSTQALTAIPLTALGLSADAITSTTTVGLGSGGLYGTGNATIEGLKLTGSLLGGLNLDLSLYADAGANTVLNLLPGLSLTFNEQLTQSVAGGLSMSTNAIHLALNDYLFDGKALSGDVILGHSEASIAGAVPEASSWAMMVVGFGLLGGMARSRKNVPARA